MGPIEAIRARNDARTPGAWGWFGLLGRVPGKHRDANVYLATQANGRQVIINVIDRDDRVHEVKCAACRHVTDYPVNGTAMMNFRKEGFMRPAVHFARARHETARDFSHLEHPDAIFIAAAPEDISRLLDTNAKLVEAVKSLTAGMAVIDLDPEVSLALELIHAG